MLFFFHGHCSCLYIWTTKEKTVKNDFVNKNSKIELERAIISKKSEKSTLFKSGL